MPQSRRLKDYRHKVGLDLLAPAPPAKPATFLDWFDRLPSILAGDDVREIVDRWVAARRARKPVIWGLGAHVIKAGLSHWLITLMEEGLITHLAMNGAVAIHDYELAAVGHTSEDVGEAMADGVFGRAEETALFINRAAGEGAAKGWGLGEAIGRALLEAGLPHVGVSVLAAARRLSVPVSVHLAIGTDTVHAHPSADGRALGQTTLADFQALCLAVAGLEGGLYVNAGSAVILPEVFLKATALARSSSQPLADMTTVTLDFIRHYRPLENVCRRPLGRGGRGFYLVGHHELMIPLLGQAVLERWRARA
jgi:hypothetical protein